MQLAGKALTSVGTALKCRQRQYVPARPSDTRLQAHAMAGAAAARNPRNVHSNVHSPSKRLKQSGGPGRFATAAAGDQTLPLVDDDRVPVTVITGFLGSGKTTLLNYILTQNHGQRIAVIENEFGEIDIDSELVVRKEVLEGTGGDMIMQLGNGCLCCTVREDLVKVLNSLWHRRKDFDHILIETTGLANPAPIISSFYMDQQLPGRVRLDGVVTVVDSKHVLKRLDEVKSEDVVNEAVEQIAYADRIVLNKTDLVSKPDLSALEARLRTINSLASIQRTQRSVVPVDYVLGVGGFDLGRIEEQVIAEQSSSHSHSHSHDHEHTDDCAPGCTDPTHNHSHDHHHDHSHDHGHSHAEASHSHSHEHGPDCAPGCTDPTHDHSHHGHDHKHDDKVSSVSFEVEGDMDLEKINYTMGALLNARGEDLYRMKGILSIEGLDERYVFQAVHQMFEGSPDRPWRSDERRVSRMVFIGRELDKEAFEEAFMRCLADAPRGAAAAGTRQAAAV